MVPRIIGMTAAPRMKKTKVGAVNTTTMSLNPIRCAVVVEVAAQQVTHNKTYWLNIPGYIT